MSASWPCPSTEHFRQGISYGTAVYSNKQGERDVKLGCFGPVVSAQGCSESYFAECSDS